VTVSAKLLETAQQIARRSSAIVNEDHVKQAVLMPLLAALGYDVFNPEAVVADFASSAERKRSERADYALLIDGKARILVKVRSGNGNLDSKMLGSLATEFAIGTARFLLLLNGRHLHVYGDVDQAGVIDLLPILAIDLHEFDKDRADALAQFAYEGFDGDGILRKAGATKLGPILRDRVAGLFAAPTGDFVAMLLRGAVHGEPGAELIARATELVRDNYRQSINDAVQSRLRRALDIEDGAAESALSAEAAPVAAQVESDASDEPQASEDELKALTIIRAIAYGLSEPGDVDLRPAQSYGAVLFRDNNRRTIARLHFKRSQYYLGLLEGDKEVRHPISSVEQIFEFADQIREAVERFAAQAPAKPARNSQEQSASDANPREDDGNTKPEPNGDDAQQEQTVPEANGEPDASEATPAPEAEAEVVEPGADGSSEPVVPPSAEEETVAPQAQAEDAIVAAEDTQSGVDSIEGLDEVLDQVTAELDDGLAADGRDAIDESIDSLLDSPIPTHSGHQPEAVS